MQPVYGGSPYLQVCLSFGIGCNDHDLEFACGYWNGPKLAAAQVANTAAMVWWPVRVGCVPS